GQGAVYLNGKIYRIGGGCSDVSGCGPKKSVEMYTISDDKWTTAPSYPIEIEELAAVQYGGFIYAAGGLTNAPGGAAYGWAATDKTYRFDGATWDDAAIADLPQAVYAAAADMYNGRWVIA